MTSLQWQTASFSELGNLQLYAALRLRQEVFAVEQVSLYLDPDNVDQDAIHMLCWRQDELLAYQRCLPPGLSYTESGLGRIVVSAPARGLQLGKELVQRGIAYNLQRWPQQDIRINAQAYLQGYYERLGFTPVGGAYEFDGIAHIYMLYRRSR